MVFYVTPWISAFAGMTGDLTTRLKRERDSGNQGNHKGCPYKLQARSSNLGLRRYV